jgi:hypothetical protein
MMIDWEADSHNIFGIHGANTDAVEFAEGSLGEEADVDRRGLTNMKSLLHDGFDGVDGRL